MSRDGQRTHRSNNKAARRKAVVAMKRLETQPQNSIARSISFAAKLPIAHCMVTKDLFDTGIGEVIIARLLPNGKLGCAVILIDMYCLGAKDAFYRELSRSELLQHTQGKRETGAFIEVDPPFARKLVNDAATYAAGLGLSAHKDYNTVEKIFGSVDAHECDKIFEFGHNGKPLYIPGPLDTPDRIAVVVKILKGHAPDQTIVAAKKPWWKFW